MDDFIPSSDIVVCDEESIGFFKKKGTIIHITSNSILSESKVPYIRLEDFHQNLFFGLSGYPEVANVLGGIEPGNSIYFGPKYCGGKEGADL